MVLKVHVIYCGGCGYAPKYEVLKNLIQKEFPRVVEVTRESTPYITGYLEVQIVGGELLHSKKNGDGYIDTAQKEMKILDGIRAALAK